MKKVMARSDDRLLSPRCSGLLVLRRPDQFCSLDQAQWFQIATVVQYSVRAAPRDEILSEVLRAQLITSVKVKSLLHNGYSNNAYELQTSGNNNKNNIINIGAFDYQ